jgi:hypothetical protein
MVTSINCVLHQAKTEIQQRKAILARNVARVRRNERMQLLSGKFGRKITTADI